MNQLILHNLQKTFRDAKGRQTHAVAGVSLAVEPGELMVLLGPSGCGKSTLLRLIAGLETPDAGRIILDGRELDGLPPAERDVAMVFQHHALFPHLDVFGNIALGLKFRGVPRAHIRDAVREAAAMLRLEGLLDRRPHQLSGGQRQRVALGRALVRRPKLFLLDEPLSNLDAHLRTELREEIARLHQRLHATMLFVTHDQAEAMTLGRRLCVLHEGRVMQTGAPLEIYRRPANTFVARFIGNPGMNLLRGPLAAALAPDLPQLRDGHRALGVRPEDVELTPEGPGVPGRVQWCEPLGHETLVHLIAGDQPLIARVPGMRECAPGREVRLRVRAEHASVFDTASGAAIS